MHFPVNLLVCWLLLGWSPLFAETPPQQDVRILIDISGSMKKNDPRNLRRPALRLLVGLLPSDSRAGVWTFGQYVNMQIPLGKVDKRWRSKAKQGAAKIHSRGLYTDIEAALKRAGKDWKTATEKETRHLLLLTDGMVDVSKNPADSSQSRERILNDLLPRLTDLGVKVHTVALSARADHELMQRLSRATGGWYEQVGDAAALQKVFLRIFEQVSKPDTLPLKDNMFKVDSSIKELTLIVFRAEDAAETKVVAPDGTSFDRASAPDHVSWHQDEGYDLLTISAPAPGDWRIQAAVDPDNRVMILTDLRMRNTPLPNRVVTGQRVPISISFEEQGKTITRREFIDVMNLSIEQLGPNELQSEPRPIQDDGQGDDPLAFDGKFELRFSPEGEKGRGELLIVAEGKTFQREKRQRFELVSPASASLSEADEEGLRTLSLSLDEQVIDAASAEYSAEVEDAGGTPKSLNLQAAADGRISARVTPGELAGKAVIRVRIRARTRTGDIVGSTLPEIEFMGAQAAPQPVPASAPAAAAEEKPAEAEAEDAGFAPWMIWLGAGNLLLLILGGVGFWLLRRKRAKDEVVLVDPEEENKAQDGDQQADQGKTKKEAKS